MKKGEFFELQFEKFRLRVPKNYWYAGYDTWVKLDGDEAVVGVTDYFQTKIGDIAFVIPVEGSSFVQDDVFASLETIKTIVDITIPVSGEVITFNEALDDHPELISQDTFGEGWIARLRLTDWEADREMLLSADKYLNLMQDKIINSLDQAE